MSEIRFTPSRMREVCNRLDEMEEQLTTVIRNDAQSFESISKVIQNTLLSGYLKNYAAGAVETSDAIVKNLGLLKNYLANQIALYEQSNANAEESLNKINSVLDQLGNV